MSRKSNFFQEALFKPSVVRAPGGRQTITLSDNFQDSFGTTHPSGSFRFDPAGSPLKSTQQLNVDFSKFENHTFFNSAKNKVHIAFEKIINQFPFDGTRKEYEQFFEGLTGFENYVFKSFPKNTGFLIFDRVGSDPGTFISINDSQGAGASLQSGVQGSNCLQINQDPFSIECSVYVPSGTVNHNEVIAQRISGSTQGFTLALSDSSGLASPLGECDVYFRLSDDYKSQEVKTRIKKGVFTHIVAIYDRNKSNRLKLVINGEQKKSSDGTIFLENFDMTDINFMIGSGSTHQTFAPKQTLSGAMDEFRYFNSSRTIRDIRKYGDQEIFSQPDLKLCFRFNEPSGSYQKDGVGTNNLCLDHSGNGLHSLIQNFDISQRNTLRIDQPSLASEDPNFSPVLFPSFEKVQNLFDTLIATASNYDYNNPNLITKMIPGHYLANESLDPRFDNDERGLEEPPGMTVDRPGGNVIKQSHLISSVLFLWANTFDETKMFIDEMSRLLKVDYKDNDTISSQLLPFLAKYHSFSLPAQFNHATIDQQLKGRNITLDKAKANHSLQSIQNTIWRRILSDLPEIRKSKGTRGSIESVLRNIGINPGTTFRIKEYGGSRRNEIRNFYEKRTQVGKMLQFSGALGPQGSIGSDGRDSGRPLITSRFLSSSRTEPGVPTIKGAFIKGVSNEPSDGLFTSGSWSCEGLFKFESPENHPPRQSLMRIHTTGSSSGVGNNWLIYNVIANKPSPRHNITGSVILYGKPDGNSSEHLSLKVDNVNIFDGQKWHVSFGRDKKDTLGYHSSSYYLRVGKSNYTSEPTLFSSSVYFYDKGNNALNNIAPDYNASGSFIAVGSMSLSYDTSSAYEFLNTLASEGDANYLLFSGKAANIRFYSKEITKDESIVHIENPRSLGTINPLKNYNFNRAKSGSFERLRLDYSMNQELTKSDGSGTTAVFDFSQNNLTGRGTGFEVSSSIYLPERYDFRTIVSKIETQPNENKVRIRSFKSYDMAEKYGTAIAPVYEIPPSEKPLDDRRVAIEVSAVQALNDDISLLFSSLDYFDNAIGDPELVFSNEYKNLRDLRRVYFNRLEDKMSFVKFFSFFKWFDDTVGDILEELIPTTSRYLGTNFVIESHALERPKFTYAYSDMYLGELERPDPGKIFVQQLIGKMRKR